MAAANLQLLQTLSQLNQKRGSATVVVDSGRIRRTLHIENGAFIGADSDVLTERLGVLLVADGKLDVKRVDPVVQSARASGKYFGDQLVEMGLLTGHDLTQALERQALTRFERSLQMNGSVSVSDKQLVRVVCRRPLAAAVLALFRSRLPLELVTSVIAGLAPTQMRLREQVVNADDLQLTSPELRIWRQLASGQDANGILDRAQDYEAAIRFIAALVGLGAMGAEKKDPVAELLRTA